MTTIFTTKERIGSAIALVSLLICLWVCGGCQSFRRYTISVDSGSALMQPTFCLYQDPHFQERLGIRGITVWKVPRPFDQKKRWEVDTPWEIGTIAWKTGSKVDEVWEGARTVWDLHYESSDSFIKRLSEWRPSTVSRLTYGEVPPGYQENMKALPLEPEAFYSVWIQGDGGELPKNTYFIIRLDSGGIPERLEYYQEIFLITKVYGLEAPCFSAYCYPQVFCGVRRWWF